MRKTIIHIILATLAVTFFSACNNSNKAQKDAKVGKGKVVAVTPTMDCLPMYIASDRGFTTTQGVDIRLKQYQSHLDTDTALLGGSAAAIFTDNIRAKLIGEKVNAIEVWQHDNLDWQLIANSKQRISKAVQLKDHMMAVTRFSATETLGKTLMDSAHLSDQQAFLVQINDITIRTKMLMENIMDAAWLPQPQATMAISAGHKVLSQSRKSNAEVYGVMALRTKNEGKAKAAVLTKNEALKLRKAYNIACDSLNKKGLGPYREIIKKYYGLNDKTIDALGKPLFRHL